MKTIQELEDRMIVISKKSETDLDKKERKQLTKEMEMLTTAKYYLEFDPDYETIQKDYAEVVRKVEYIKNSENYVSWLNCTPNVKTLKNPESKWKSEMGYTSLLKQKANLEFIAPELLSDD